MTALADLWIAVLAGLTVGAFTGLGLALLQRPLIAAARRFAPNMRALGLFGVIVAPFAMAVITAVFTATLAHALFIDVISHHCHVTTETCTAHAPTPSSDFLFAAGAGLITAAALWIGLSLIDSLSRAGEQARLLRAASVRQEEGDYLLPTDKVVAVSGGLLHPDTFISRGLRRNLTALQFDVVRLHEATHGRRGDTIVRILAGALGVGHWPGAGRAYFDELVLAQEQACDQTTAHRFGALETAETLLAVEKLQRTQGQAATGCACPAFMDTAIEARTRALLAPRFIPDYAGAMLLIAGLITAVAFAMMSAEPLHHEIKSLIFLLQS